MRIIDSLTNAERCKTNRILPLPPRRRRRRIESNKNYSSRSKRSKRSTAVVSNACFFPPSSHENVEAKSILNFRLNPTRVRREPSTKTRGGRADEMFKK